MESMSDAELVIRLIGDATPEEQAAISQPMPSPVDPRDNRPAENREPENRDGSSRPMGATSAPANPQRTFDPSASSPKSEAEPPSVAQVMENIREAFRDGSMGSQGNSFEVSVAKFGQYVESLIAARPTPTREAAIVEQRSTSPSTRTNTWLSKLENRSPLIKKVANRFRQGRQSVSMLSSAAQKWAATPGRTRVGKAARSVVSRVLGGGTQVAGRAASTAAANVAAGAATGGAGAAAGGGAGAAASTGAVAAFGVSVGAVTAGLTVVAISAVAAAKAFNNAADDIERYSADVSLARARGRVNTELNMLDRAQRIGAASGRLETAKASLGNQTEKLLTDILAIVAQFEPLLSSGLNFAEAQAISTRTLLAVAQRGVAAIEVERAKLTPDKNDDAKAEKRLEDADKKLAGLAEEFGKVIVKALENIAGGGEKEKAEGDPFLKALLEVELDDQGNFIKKK